jgi:hypothetical protein
MSASSVLVAEDTGVFLTPKLLPRPSSGLWLPLSCSLSSITIGASSRRCAAETCVLGTSEAALLLSLIVIGVLPRAASCEVMFG